MRRALTLLLVAFVAALLLVGCGGSRATLKVLAGSELEDLEPLLPEIERQTGVRLEMEYIGSLTGAEKLSAGPAGYDLAWFSHGKYLELIGRERNLVQAQEKIMLSPVVLGVKQNTAQRLGWSGRTDVTWREIAEAARSGQLRFALTNPAASNSGFTAVVGVATALTGKGDALTTADIETVDLQGFLKGQTLTAGSSGWLAESFVNSQDALDGMVNYESVLLALNESGKLKERLTLIYPEDGIITADYPLMLLNQAKRSDYDRLVTYLRSPEFQSEMMARTLRRPAIPGVRLDARIPDTLLIELPFPNTLEVIDALLFSYLDRQRVPSHAFFVLDVSGSMAGEGLAGLKQALDGLTGLDTSLTGRFSRFRERERVSMLTFNEELQPRRDFRIDEPAAEATGMQEIRNFTARLEAGGGTAIYSALAQALRDALVARGQDPNRYYSIVLMSDGESNRGMSEEEFRRFYDALPREAKDIRVFTVVFGKADRNAMDRIAEMTGGRSFDGTRDPLDVIFKQIRGYQ